MLNRNLCRVEQEIASGDTLRLYDVANILGVTMSHCRSWVRCGVPASEPGLKLCLEAYAFGRFPQWETSVRALRRFFSASRNLHYYLDRLNARFPAENLIAVSTPETEASLDCESRSVSAIAQIGVAATVTWADTKR